MRALLEGREVAALLVEEHRDRVNRLERAADATGPFSRAADDGADLPDLFGDERGDEIALAELDGPDDERFALEEGHPTSMPRDSVCDSSAGMSCPRGLRTMESASDSRMSKRTNAIATPNRRPPCPSRAA